MTEKHLIGYKAYWDDTYNAVVNDPIYSETPPPVDLREEYLGELVMRLWYLLNVDYRLGLPEVKVSVNRAAYLRIESGDGEKMVSDVSVDGRLLSYDELLETVLRNALQHRSTNLKDASFTTHHNAQYEAWRSKQ